MRSTDYIRTALKDSGRRPFRLLLTTLALAISATIFVTLTSISLGTRQAINGGLGMDSSLSTIIVTPNKNIDGGLFGGGSIQITNDHTEKLDQSTVDTLRSLPHVSSVMPRAGIWEFKQFHVDGSDKNFVAKTNAIAPSHSSAVPLVAGRMFVANEASHHVIIGNSYAKALGYDNKPADLVGQTIVITTQNGYRGEGANLPPRTATRTDLEAFAATPTQLRAQIRGVTAPGVQDSQLLIPLEWARQIETPRAWTANGLTGEDQIAKNGYTSIIIQADSTAQVRSLSQLIIDRGYGVFSTQQQIDRLQQFTTVMWVILGAVSLVSLITACLGIANTMLMTVSEERYIIAVWRACGARQRSIALQYLLRAGLVGLLGGCLGILAGKLTSDYVNHIVAKLLVAQGLPPIEIANPAWYLLTATLGMTIVLAILSALQPALRAARQDPSRALQSV